MTNFSEAARNFEQLNAIAPEFFIEIRSEEDLKRATDFLYTFDKEVRGDPNQPKAHPLDPLASALMHRIMAYEEALMPPAAPDMELRVLLEVNKLTQQQLAAATGIDQGMISKLASGKRSFTADHARKLGEYFGVNPGVFL